MPDGARTNRSIPYRVSVAIILLCGLIGAVATFLQTRRDEDRHAQADFEHRVDLRHALTREVLQRYTEAMAGLSSIFTLDRDISREEFVRATTQLQPRLSGALAFEWAPYVSRSDRPRIEQFLQRRYAPQRFEIVEFTADDRMKRAADRPYYYPICYVEPMRGNEIVLGYDILTAPTRPYLERARESRQMSVSHQFRLRQETGNELGFVIILPVFRGSRASDIASTPDPDLPSGYLQCVFHVRAFLADAVKNDSDPYIEMLFVDRSESDPARRTLYCHVASPAGDASMPDESTFRAQASLIRERSLELGERDWRVLYRPTAGWLETQRSLAPFWRAITLMALCGLLAGIVSVIGRRAKIVRREVEERTAELAESRRQFANLLHSLPGMAYRARYAGTLQILFASEGALALTGCPGEDFVSGAAHVRDFIHPDDLARVRAETRASILARRDVEVTYRLKTRSGEEKWVLSRGRGVYREDGKLDVVEGIVVDITDQKRAEEARLALERKLLEGQKLESLGLLAGGIAHDFNNLLSAILGNASLARLTLEPGNAADAQLRAIETASLRAAELCRQMLAYAGKGRFVVERVDLSAIVEDLLPLLRVSIARSAVLRLDLMKQIPGVKADATQIRQIVMNLVLNAVDALSGRNGEIRIWTGITEVDQPLLARCVTGQNLPLGSYVFLEVSDTGAGMPPEVLAKIFDPFFTTKFAGRGLGLAAVLGIVRGHNGALLVESEVNRGTRFRLFLPAIVGEVPRVDSPVEIPESWHQTGDVLVIEDEEPVRVVMSALLKNIGFEPHAVADGRAGVEAFRNDPGRWSLVIVDLIMPGLSGVETLAAIRSIRAEIRCLLVSGHAESEVLQRVALEPHIGFLAKPFKREVFENKLKELFS
jgi:PAS domain S-box-containing protein